MTDPTLPDEPYDPTADTGRFQAFFDEGDGDGEDEPAPAGVPFRVVTLVAGLLVLGALVLLLFLL